MHSSIYSIRTSGYNYLVAIIILILSIITSGLILFDVARPPQYGMTCLLPLAFAFTAIPLLLQNKPFEYIYSTIILLTYFGRNVITPLFMVLGGYQSALLGNVILETIPEASLIMVFDTIVVLTFLSRTLSRHPIDEIKYNINIANCKLSKKLALFIVILIVLGILILRIDSSIGQHTFLYLLDTEKEYFALSDPSKGIGTLSMYVQLISTIFVIIQIFLPPMLLYYISKIKLVFIRTLLYVTLVVIVCVVATEDRLNSLLAGIALLLTMRDVLGDEFRNKFKVLLTSFLILSMIALLIKTNAFSGNGDVNYVDVYTTFAAYFSYIPTVADGVLFLENDGRFQIFSIIPDFISKIPYASYILNMFADVHLQNSNQSFNIFISNQIGHSIGQILPTTMVGVRYFGYLLAPLFPCILVSISNRFETKINEQKNIVSRMLYIWITVCCSMSLVVASGLLVMGKIAWFYILKIIFKLFDRNKSI